MNIVDFQPWPLAGLTRRDLLQTRRHASERDAADADWSPAVDIIEMAERFVLRADIPGMAADDVDISVDDSILAVSGERRPETDEASVGVRRRERAVGRFRRRFLLPDTADQDGITASVANGIVEISIPKQPRSQARHITIEAA